MKLTYKNFGIRLVEKDTFGTEKDYRFVQGVAQKISEKDAKIILERTRGEFEAETPKEPARRGANPAV